ncbi:MAG TPA: hypothetical protein VG388_10170, partial [Solirubrobacteraceae bacterium]|nr:hypothetical protein [Solirubrobacteraceae bacterium]
MSGLIRFRRYLLVLAVGFAALAAGGLADLDPVSAARGARARVSEAVVPAVVDRWQARGGT